MFSRLKPQRGRIRVMKQFLILLLVVAGTHAFFPVGETTCNLTHNTCPCTPLIEGTVYIQVMTNASGREVKFLKVLPNRNITVLSLKKEKITMTDKEFNNRLQFIFENGTLKITNVRRNDSGHYSTEVLNSDGVQEKNIHFTLDVKDKGKVEGVETYCDGRQDGAQCYGALGGSVEIKLMDNTSKIPRYHLLKNSLKILDVKDNIALPNITEYRSVIFPCNGTFRLSDLSRNDSGNYTLQTFDSDGRSTGERTFQLFIQAPVSSVLLLSECLSLGERRVSCSSEGGDSPQYSWTLDGRTLTDAELLSGNNESNNITLKQHVSGRLVCSVKNNVSNVSKEQRIYICAVILLLMVGVLSVLVIFLVVGIAVICFQKEKQNNKSVKQKEEEDDQVERRAVAKVEVEVQYAQVKSTKRSRHTKPTGGDCLYAKVHKGDLSDC
ncbi:unnamed protein product [Oreochromis niloticus]|nr:unnamed protein product [Mustela putorius furo]